MKHFLLAILIYFSLNTLFAQAIEGSVLDINKMPIPDAQILNLNTAIHTHSDDRGRFFMERTEIGDTLKVFYLGYETQIAIVEEFEKPLTIFLTESAISLSAVLISPELNALNVLTDINLKVDPVSNSQDILRQVPGLFIGQHAGGGKAEQIFLRGFDIDHGTDIAISVDGLPVNMVSHAHGQGYADLHFVIPETVQKIDFGKGPYYADHGNFNTAGYVDFKLKSSLDQSSIKLELGQFNTNRILGQFKIINSEKHQAYIATSYLSTDGPFESPQNFSRLNILGKYTAEISKTSTIGLTLSHFTSEWDASGQVPQRSIDDGSIGRFGAIDDTEGGNTSRSDVALTYNKILNTQSSIRNTLFISNYDFELYSNFTFFLNDPINGDQIRQQEDRTLFGFNSEYFSTFTADRFDGDWQVGISFRNDNSDNNELSRTSNRVNTLSRVQFGDIDETNIGLYTSANFDFGKWNINTGLRLDHFEYQYNDFLQVNYQTQSTSKSIVSPKLNVMYNLNSSVQLYLKTGKGFHSNDSRVVIAQTSQEILPAAYGADLGFIWKPFSKLFINAAYWNLYLEQEFVYVGDEGVVEPSGRTHRQGLEFSARYQPLDILFLNLDANYTIAKSLGEPEGENFIPLAPDFTLAASASIIHPSGWFGSTHFRHLQTRPANEDNSIEAIGYGVVDLKAGYQWKNLSLGVKILNLLDTEWNETQFATESRLQNELAPTEEIHFTPGAPFFFQAEVEYKF